MPIDGLVIAEWPIDGSVIAECRSTDR